MKKMVKYLKYSFTGKRLGIFVRPPGDGNGAVVDRVTSEYAYNNNVRVRDVLIGINGKSIIGLPFNHITRIVQSVGQPVTIRFQEGPRDMYEDEHNHFHHGQKTQLDDGEMSGECAAYWLP
eukprot:UN00024